MNQIFTIFQLRITVLEAHFLVTSILHQFNLLKLCPIFDNQDGMMADFVRPFEQMGC